MGSGVSCVEQQSVGFNTLGGRTGKKKKWRVTVNYGSPRRRDFVQTRLSSIPCNIKLNCVLEENLESHLNRCPLLKQANSLHRQPFYQEGINAGREDGEEEQTSTKDSIFTSEMKRNAVYAMSVFEFSNLIAKIKSVHASICNCIPDSYKIPEACSIWTSRQVDKKIPYQEKHVLQQASILGNLEEFGVLKKSCLGLDAPSNQCDSNGESETCKDVSAVVEFGAGRGYLTQMLADCYGIKKVLFVERKSYKLKADRSLRQKESLALERLRIDIEDLNLNAVKFLEGATYIAIGKHLCGPATDKRYMFDLGFTKEDFHKISWFTSWAVDADHSSEVYATDCSTQLDIMSEKKELCLDSDLCGVEDIARNMPPIDRAVLGFMCKDIIDAGRLMWIKAQGLKSELVKYVPSSISPENHLLVASPSILVEQ
ncbi:hypothetical protein RD792_009273 [Penstemon davidsonii]|uniref:tRNA:m(4)X modification enzyme TRM13 n=1 Tax=Penstemon davidsonii TaxID=160366 RepID=A0ABR0CYK7_9LAMI|nr:hypothetical protein RD792_009273 [Penstemon davidsonii]